MLCFIILFPTSAAAAVIAAVFGLHWVVALKMYN